MRINFIIILISLLFSGTVYTFNGTGLEDLASTLNIEGDQQFPAMSGSWLAWYDKYTESVSGVRFSDGATLEISAGVQAMPFFPSLSSRYCVFVGKTGVSNDIWARDLITGDIHNICSDASEAFDPSAGERWIAWVDYRHGNSDIYIYDLGLDGIYNTADDAGEFRITSDPASGGRPFVHGDYIIWEDSRTGSWNVYLQDMISEEQRRLTFTDKDQRRPRLYGNVAVWEERDGTGASDIVLYSMSSGTFRYLDKSDDAQINPAVSGDHVFWQQDSGDQWRIKHYNIVTDILEWSVDINEDTGTPAPWNDRVAVYCTGVDLDIKLFDHSRPEFSGLYSATPGNAAGSVFLEWSSATDFLKPISYNVYVSTNSGVFDWNSPYTNINENSVTLNSLSTGVTHYFAVRAVDTAGNTDTNLIQKNATPSAGDTTPPYVIDVYPSPNDKGVPSAATLEISFSESMTETSAESSVSVEPYAGQLVFKWSGNTLHVKPSSLTTDRVYTITVSTEAMDSVGNKMASPYSFTFSTVDTISPSIISVYPDNLSSMVDTNTYVNITFSESMNRSKTQSALRVNGSVLYGSFSWIGDTMRFQPDEPFNYSSSISFTIKAVAEDQQANTITGDYNWSFTTAPDTSAPVFSGIKYATPVEGYNDRLKVSWQSASDRSLPIKYYLYVANSSGTQNFSSPWASVIGDLSYTLTGLNPVSTYYIVVRAEDSYGNMESNSKELLVSPGEIDFLPPEVVSTIPEHGSLQVSASTSIVIEFSETVSTGDIDEAVSITPSVPGEFQWSTSSTLKFIPENSFGFNRTIKVSAGPGFYDSNGNMMNYVYNFNFETESPPDVLPPEIVKVMPVNGSSEVDVDIEEVFIEFNEQLSQESINGISLFSDRGYVKGTAVYYPDLYRLAIRPETALAHSTRYTLVSGTEEISDISGNVLTSGFESQFYTVADTESPVFNGIESISEASGKIWINWNKATDSSSPIEYRLYLSNVSGGQDFSAFDEATVETWLVMDAAPYIGSTVYAVVRAMDSSGNMDDNTREISLSVSGGIDVLPPEVVFTNPENGSVALNSITVEVWFNEPLDNSSLSYIKLRSNLGDINVQKSFGSGDLAIRLKPSQPLDYSTSYTLYAGTDIMDKSFNTLQDTYEVTFSTVPSPDSTNPYITLISPYKGEEDVSPTETITINFSEDLAPWTVNTDSVKINDGVLKISVQLTGSQVIITPVDDLPYGEICIIKLSSSITDMAGNSLDGEPGLPGISTYESWFAVGTSTESLKTADISLEKGLNLISMPLRTPGTMTAEDLCEEIGAAFVMRYDSISQQFVGYLSGTAGYSGFDILPGEGYMIHTDASGTAEITGTDHLDGVITVGKGWNLIGPKLSAALNSRELMEALSSDALIRTSNGKFQAFISSSEAFDIEPGRGYFIRSSSDVTGDLRNLCQGKSLVPERRVNAEYQATGEKRNMASADFGIFYGTGAVPGTLIDITLPDGTIKSILADSDGCFSLVEMYPGSKKDVVSGTVIARERRHNQRNIKEKISEDIWRGLLPENWTGGLVLMDKESENNRYASASKSIVKRHSVSVRNSEKSPFVHYGHYSSAYNKGYFAIPFGIMAENPEVFRTSFEHFWAVSFFPGRKPELINLTEDEAYSELTADSLVIGFDSSETLSIISRKSKKYRHVKTPSIGEGWNAVFMPEGDCEDILYGVIDRQFEIFEFNDYKFNGWHPVFFNAQMNTVISLWESYENVISTEEETYGEEHKDYAPFLLLENVSGIKTLAKEEYGLDSRKNGSEGIFGIALKKSNKNETFKGECYLLTSSRGQLQSGKTYELNLEDKAEKVKINFTEQEIASGFATR